MNYQPVQVQVEGFLGLYDYIADEELGLDIGDRVRVPFGRAIRTGRVADFAKPSYEGGLKQVIEKHVAYLSDLKVYDILGDTAVFRHPAGGEQHDLCIEATDRCSGENVLLRFSPQQVVDIRDWLTEYINL